MRMDFGGCLFMALTEQLMLTMEDEAVEAHW